MSISINSLVESINNLTSLETVAANERYTHAVKRNQKNFKPIGEAFKEKLEDVNIECASIDDKGNLITDEKGNYKFTPEKLKERNKKIKELKSELVEFTPYLISLETVEKLDEFQKEDISLFIEPIK